MMPLHTASSSTKEKQMRSSSGNAGRKNNDNAVAEYIKPTSSTAVRRRVTELSAVAASRANHRVRVLKRVRQTRARRSRGCAQMPMMTTITATQASKLVRGTWGAAIAAISKVTNDHCTTTLTW